jgi:hypothetical protein
MISSPGHGPVTVVAGTALELSLSVDGFPRGGASASGWRVL